MWPTFCSVSCLHSLALVRLPCPSTRLPPPLLPNPFASTWTCSRTEPGPGPCPARSETRILFPWPTRENKCIICNICSFSVHGENCLKWHQMGLGRSFSGKSRPCRHFGRHWFGFWEFTFSWIPTFWISGFPDFQNLAWAGLGLGGPSGAPWALEEPVQAHADYPKWVHVAPNGLVLRLFEALYITTHQDDFQTPSDLWKKRSWKSPPNHKICSLASLRCNGHVNIKIP